MSDTQTPNDAPVLVSRHGPVLQLTLNAPHNRNSLQTPGIYEGLMAGLEKLESDAGLRAAILTGAGGAFCSGGDLRQLAAGSEDEIVHA